MKVILTHKKMPSVISNEDYQFDLLVHHDNNDVTILRRVDEYSWMIRRRIPAGYVAEIPTHHL